VAFKELDEGIVTQWFTAFFAMAANQKDKWTFRIFRSFLHHIRIERLKRFGLQEINDSLCPRFRSGTLGMVGPIADDHTLLPILDVIQMQRQDLTLS